MTCKHDCSPEKGIHEIGCCCDSKESFITQNYCDCKCHKFGEENETCGGNCVDNHHNIFNEIKIDIAEKIIKDIDNANISAKESINRAELQKRVIKNLSKLNVCLFLEVEKEVSKLKRFTATIFRGDRIPSLQDEYVIPDTNLQRLLYDIKNKLCE